MIFVLTPNFAHYTIAMEALSAGKHVFCEKPITVAVMGCVVNGPGEAREADIGIAGGDGWGMIFEKGVQVEKLPYDELLPALLKRIEAL